MKRPMLVIWSESKTNQYGWGMAYIANIGITELSCELFMLKNSPDILKQDTINK